MIVIVICTEFMHVHTAYVPELKICMHNVTRHAA
jgi:hypothetical protein